MSKVNIEYIFLFLSLNTMIYKIKYLILFFIYEFLCNFMFFFLLFLFLFYHCLLLKSE